jgi:DNA excision repair protein ERCC-2
MEISNKIKISVRDLIELVLRCGDLVSSFHSSSRNVDAIKAHQKIQKNSKEDYKSEVTISHTVIRDGVEIEIKGRIDGVITKDSDVIIDEIKTTTNILENIDEEYNLLHWAQVKCYAYFYCLDNEMDSIYTRLSYYQMDSGEIKYFSKNNTLLELKNFFDDIIDKFIYLAKFQNKLKTERNLAIEKLKFPYGEYRKGQREFSIAVYRTIMENRNLFVKAPTGIGKTMGVIFPSIKALNEGLISKIFYTTAKTTTAKEAKKALDILKHNGLMLKAVFVTAKDKICFQEESNCDPEVCEYAKGHFNRINDAIVSILETDLLTKEIIEKYAKQHKVCPFEFSLDLTNWCDIVVCDYNYIFDPRVYLRRFFMEDGGDYVLLIDEAHNLIDRSREMYSAEIYKKEILNLKNITKEKFQGISKALNKINSIMIKMRNACKERETNFIIEKSPPKEILKPLNNFIKEAEKHFQNHEESDIDENILDFYFKANAFVRTYEYFDEKYVTYTENSYEDLMLKIFCVDPSTRLSECLKKVKSAIFFSATLTPMDYFMKLLGGNDESYKANFESPFDRENLCLLLDDSISTKYLDRKYSYEKIVETIRVCISEKTGNYIVFFPSYEYMNNVLEIFQDKNKDIKIINQKSNMSDADKEQFIKAFSEKNSETLLGFAVLGGAFSEGLDLAGEKLIGVIIIGVGLPKICIENNIIKEHFGEGSKEGFLYAYVYPGMNKVLQAAGRVIRTEKDRGVVVLMDNRYGENQYRRIMPSEWKDIKRINIPKKDVGNVFSKFWNDNHDVNN